MYHECFNTVCEGGFDELLKIKQNIALFKSQCLIFPMEAISIFMCGSFL